MLNKSIKYKKQKLQGDYISIESVLTMCVIDETDYFQKIGNKE